MSVQDILLQQAMQDSLDQPDPTVAMGIGGVGGALAGIGLGHLPQKGAEALTGFIANPRVPAIQTTAPTQPVTGPNGTPTGRKMAQRMKGAIRPGFRAAGGLIGLITGGALGAGAANMMRQSSPAGEMLARIQATGGDLTAMEEVQLQKILADSYNNMGRM